MRVRFDQIRAWRLVVLMALTAVSLFSMQAGLAHSDEPAGFVLMTSGEVVAVQANNDLRPLKRKSPFYSGESLRTGENGKAQFRFRDGSLISLRPSSEIRLDEFHFNEPDKGKDKNIFTLIRGGFRTITGKIGKGDPNAYQMKSSVASIGVRGTTYEAVLQGGLDVAAWQGTIIVSNRHGSLLVGVEGLFNFASVSSSNDAPQGLMRPPATLQQSPEIGTEEMFRTTVTDSGDEERAALEILENGGKTSTATAILESGSEVTPLEKVLSEIADNLAAQAVGSGTESTLIGTLTPPPPVTLVDNRVSGVTLDRLGMAVGGGTGFNGILASGKAGHDNNGLLYIADNNLDPSQLGFDTTPYITVLSQGLAVAASIPSSSVIDANHTVEWGGWQTTTLQPAYLMTDASNPSIYAAITQPVYWITATASANTAIAARTGLAQYRSTLGFAGSSNSGPIDQVYMNLSVNFDTGAATGEVHIYAPGQYWDVKLAGSVTAPTLNFTSVSGTLNSAGTVTGEFSSLFTGNSAQAIVSSFDLSLSGDPSTHVEGVALVNDQGADLRLTTAEAASLNRFGVITQSNALSGSGVLMGQASDGAGGSPLFALNPLASTDPFYGSSINMDLLRRNGALLPQGVYTHGTYPVSWGIWDAGSLLQLSDFDPNAGQSLVLADPVVWMTVVPTLNTAVTARGGRGFYHFSQCCAGFGLVNGGGQITSTDFDLSVDFDRATFFGQMVLNEIDTDYWNLQFTGTVQGASLAVTPPFINGVYYNAASTTSYTPSGDLVMTLTGTNGEAVAVLFDLEATGMPGFYTQGVFVAEPDLRLTLAEMSSMSYMALTSGNPIGSWWHMSTAADGANTPIFAGDITTGPNSGAFYLSSNGTVWRKGNATETKLGSYQVMSSPTYAVNWGRWDAAGLGNAIVAQTDATNSAAQTLYASGTSHWMVFTPTPSTALAAKTGTVNYNAPVAIAVNATDGALATVGGFTFGATVDFDTGALNSGLITLTHATGQNWNMNFSAPAGSLGNSGAFPYIGATGTYTDTVPSTVSATGNVGLMTTGSNAEALAGSLSFTSAGGSVDGVFLVCQSGGC